MSEQWVIYDSFHNGTSAEFSGENGRQRAIKWARSEVNEVGQSLVVIGMNTDIKQVIESIVIHPES